MKTNKTKTTWQYLEHKTQDEDKQNPPDNIGNTKHRMKTNKTKTTWQY
jgi:hypothetical protein